jgi:hypothetical protein
MARWPCTNIINKRLYFAVVLQPFKRFVPRDDVVVRMCDVFFAFVGVITNKYLNAVIRQRLSLPHSYW